MATLTKASRQWANRPADESYQSLEALHAAALAAADRARKAVVSTRDLHPVVVDNGDIALNGRSGINAPLTHWSFGQLARIADAPADYLRQLPADLAVDCLEQGIKNPQTSHDDNTLVLFDQNGSTKVRALTSTRYARIMNVEVTSRLIRLADKNPEWQPAPAAMDGKRGLYMGDRDMFAFLVDNGRRVFEQAPGGGLSRGFFAWNSEVGAESFGLCQFLYEYICGNHIVWGAKAIRELRIRHVGNAEARAFDGLEATVTEYLDSTAGREEELIGRAQKYRIAETKDEVLDKVFGLRVPALSRKVIEQSYAIAEQFVDRYGDPRTAWAVANGITQFSQGKQYANQRVELDRAGGKVLDMAF